MGQPVKVIKEGEPAKHDGFLVKPEQMKKFRKIDQDNITLQDLRVVQDKRIEFYKKEVEKVQDELSSQKTKTFWSNAGYFFLGVLTTSIASYAAIQATR
jgi:hypothetical protein